MKIEINTGNIDELIKKIQSGDRRATSKLITECEGSYDFLKNASSHIFPLTGKIKYIGVAGSFGVGKSTLLDGLIKSARKQNYRAGVIAVDPKSPFTGGSILGDRVRMERHSLDEGVFIRSLSSKSESVTPEVIVISRILELWGADMVFIETAGLGQTQTEISSVSDIVMLLVQPQAGDEIQLMKAGIMEIADLIVITKCDILEPYSIASALMAEVGNKKVKVFQTGLNLPKNYDILFEELKGFKTEGPRGMLKNTIEWLMIKKFKDEFFDKFLTDKIPDEISDKNSNPFEIADKLFERIFNNKRR